MMCSVFVALLCAAFVLLAQVSALPTDDYNSYLFRELYPHRDGKMEVYQGPEYLKTAGTRWTYQNVDIQDGIVLTPQCNENSWKDGPRAIVVEDCKILGNLYINLEESSRGCQIFVDIRNNALTDGAVIINKPHLYGSHINVFNNTSDGGWFSKHTSKVVSVPNFNGDWHLFMFVSSLVANRSVVNVSNNIVNVETRAHTKYTATFYFTGTTSLPIEGKIVVDRNFFETKTVGAAIQYNEGVRFDALNMYNRSGFYITNTEMNTLGQSRSSATIALISSVKVAQSLTVRFFSAFRIVNSTLLSRGYYCHVWHSMFQGNVQFEYDSVLDIDNSLLYTDARGGTATRQIIALSFYFSASVTFSDSAFITKNSNVTMISRASPIPAQEQQQYKFLGNVTLDDGAVFLWEGNNITNIGNMMTGKAFHFAGNLDLAATDASFSLMRNRITTNGGTMWNANSIVQVVGEIAIGGAGTKNTTFSIADNIFAGPEKILTAEKGVVGGAMAVRCNTVNTNVLESAADYDAVMVPTLRASIDTVISPCTKCVVEVDCYVGNTAAVVRNTTLDRCDCLCGNVETNSLRCRPLKGTFAGLPPYITKTQPITVSPSKMTPSISLSASNSTSLSFSVSPSKGTATPSKELTRSNSMSPTFSKEATRSASFSPTASDSMTHPTQSRTLSRGTETVSPNTKSMSRTPSSSISNSFSPSLPPTTSLTIPPTPAPPTPVPPTPEPPTMAPIPQEVEHAHTAAFGVSGATALATPTVAAQASRALVVLAFSSCAYDLDEELDWTFSPTQLSLDSDATAQYTGAVVGNLAIVAGVVVLHGVLAKTLGSSGGGFGDEQPQPPRKSRRGGPKSLHAPTEPLKPKPNPLAKFRFPSASLMTATMMLLLPTTSSATTTIRHGVSEMSTGVGAGFFVVVLVGVGGVANKLRSGFKSSWDLTPPEKRPTGLALFMNGNGKWADMRYRRTNTVIAEGYTKMYGRFYKDYGGDYQWFALIEVAMSIACGVVHGWKSKDPSVCDAQLYALVALHAMYVLLLLAKRPFPTKYDFCGFTMIALAQLVSALAMVLGAKTISERAALGSLVLAVLKGIIDLGREIHNMMAQNELKKEEQKEAEEAAAKKKEESAALEVPLMKVDMGIQHDGDMIPMGPPPPTAPPRSHELFAEFMAGPPPHPEGDGKWHFDDHRGQGRGARGGARSHGWFFPSSPPQQDTTSAPHKSDDKKPRTPPPPPKPPEVEEEQYLYHPPPSRRRPQTFDGHDEENFGSGGAHRHRQGPIVKDHQSSLNIAYGM